MDICVTYVWQKNKYDISYDLPINLRYIYKRVSPLLLLFTHFLASLIVRRVLLRGGQTNKQKTKQKQMQQIKNWKKTNATNGQN